LCAEGEPIFNGFATTEAGLDVLDLIYRISLFVEIPQQISCGISTIMG
jgi:hypothetical protein